MTDPSRLYEIWVYLQAEPLFWLTLTIGAYLCADFLYQKTNLFPLLNPVAMSILIVSGCLLIFDIEYEHYFSGAKFIHFLLGPATVALAVPIYQNWRIIRSESMVILTVIILGSVFAVLISYGLGLLFGLDSVTIASLMPRSVTAPIAMGISELIGGTRLWYRASKSWHWHCARNEPQSDSRRVRCCCYGTQRHCYLVNRAARLSAVILSKPSRPIRVLLIR